MTASESFAAFQRLIHEVVRDGNRVELHRENRVTSARRVICGDCGRGPSLDGRCQSCGGPAFDAVELDREKERFLSFVAAVDGPQQVALFPPAEPLRLVAKKTA